MSTGAGLGVSAGSATITATNGGLTASVSYTVVDGTLITPNQSSLSVAAGGSAGTFTVTCRKANGTTDSSPTYTATSTDTSKATVSQSGTTVTVTPVAQGSCTINLSYTDVAGTATNSVAITVTAAGGGGGVTSVTVSPNRQLLFSNQTQQLTAKDQSGNVLDNTVGSWSSSDPTNAPISSTGIVTAADAVWGATFTYTHTASGKTGTAKMTGLRGGWSPIVRDTVTYANDAALRAAISSSATTGSGTFGTTPAPTGPGLAALYNDAADQGLMRIDTTGNAITFGGRTTIAQYFPDSSGVSGQLAHILANDTTLTRIWYYRVERHSPGGEVTPYGTTVPFTVGVTTGLPNAWVGGNAAYKANGSLNVMGAGNARAQTGYADGGGGTGDNTICDTDYYSPVVVGANTYSVEAHGPSKAQPEFTANEWYVRVEVKEIRGRNIVSQRQFLGQIGTVPTWQDSMQAEVAVGTSAQLYFGTEFFPYGLNYNLQRPAGFVLMRNFAEFALLHGVTYGDPFGILGAQPTPTISSVNIASIAVGATTVTLTITGTGFTNNCWPVFSNSGIHTTPNTTSTVTSSNGAHLTVTATTITMTIDCDSGATTGAGTVAVYNAASQVTSGTQPFSVV
jgi:hypothetical protein